MQPGGNDFMSASQRDSHCHPHLAISTVLNGSRQNWLASLPVFDNVLSILGTQMLGSCTSP